MESAANKHCFVNCSDFSTYHILSKPDKSQYASKRGQLHIIGHGAVTKTIVSGLLRTTITFKHAIYTPDLIVNLVSISELDEANCWALVGDGGVTFCDISNGQKRTLITGAGNDRMYLNIEPHMLSLLALSQNPPILKSGTDALGMLVFAPLWIWPKGD